MKSDERVAELHALLMQRVEQVVTGEDWTRFLTESQRFHRYSAGNRMLIAAQLIERGVDPGGLTASYRTWQQIEATDGRPCQVRKGEQALWIQAPMTATRRDIDPDTGESTVVAIGIKGFKAVPVFHQSQLHAPPATTQPPLPELLQGDDAPVIVREAIEAEIKLAGYRLAVVDREPGVEWNGQTSFTHREVRLQSDLSPVQSLKTLAHEWAHITLGHEGISGADRARAEVEAESVAFVVMGAIGIDSGDYTIPYVSGWAGGNADVVRSTAERVLSTSARLVERIELQLAVPLVQDPLIDAPRVGGPERSVAEQPAEIRSKIVADAEVPLPKADLQLLPGERAELANATATERVAFLLASAGYTADEAVAVFKDLGVGRTTAKTALTAIHPYDSIELEAEPLYQPADVTKALDRTYWHPSRGEPPAVERGLALVRQWTDTQPPAAHPTLNRELGGHP